MFKNYNIKEIFKPKLIFWYTWQIYFPPLNLLFSPLYDLSLSSLVTSFSLDIYVS